MAKAYRIEVFDYIMSKVGKIGPRVKEYLKEAGYEKWSRCHSPVNRGRMMTSNIAECINGCLVEARELSIIGFLEKVRILFAAGNCNNNEIVKAAGSYLYCVYESGRRYITNIDHGTYNCYWYQIDEIPCAHVIAVLKSKNFDVKEYGRYCSELYRPNTIVKMYELLIVPMLDTKDWNVLEFINAEKVLPPKYKGPSSRPKKGRHLKSSESLTASSNHCGKCGRADHNWRTCDYFLKEC
ncbi:uncharacterized protein LOC107849026 [Capsicum annuum]|uniref:uncharacterized protein LOC107849026 n=1 Tax=Capsicum annuum TaxID=4072 RepID=UPI001FB18F1D|nr:uncharacterized protein LOC107849026 [Capsicum annuum]